MVYRALFDLGRCLCWQMNVDPESLIPKLPRPQDLQPYPTKQSILFKGHSARVTCISVDPTGLWLASGMAYYFLGV